MIEQIIIQNELFNYQHLGEATSTNTIAKEYKQQESQKNWLIVADSQTAGYGRFGRSFYSPNESGIYLTFTLPGNFKIAEEDCLTFLAALGVAVEIENKSAQVTGIKWVNDIYINNKKVAGILTENIILANGNQQIIIGIGINISQQKTEKQPIDLLYKRGFIYDTAHTLTSVTKKEWAISIVSRILGMLHTKSKQSYLNAYQDRCLTLKKQVSWVKSGQSFSGYAKTLTHKGELVVQMADGTDLILNHGDVSITPPVKEE